MASSPLSAEADESRRLKADESVRSRGQADDSGGSGTSGGGGGDGGCVADGISSRKRLSMFKRKVKAGDDGKVWGKNV